MGRTAGTTASSNVAKECLAYCTSCKMDLNHIIAAMKGDKIARVQCLTCKKEHTYKAPKGVTDPSEAKAPKAKRASKKKDKAADEAASGQAIELEWEKLMAAHRDTPMKTYAMKSHFLLGDKINHSTFGEGIIGKLIYPNKIEVIFRNDVKVLIHGGA